MDSALALGPLMYEVTFNNKLFEIIFQIIFILLYGIEKTLNV